MKYPCHLWIRLVTAALIAGLWLACTETPQAPASTGNTEGLWRDSDGVYIDTLTGVTFADMPLGFRNFYAYCSDCHSLRGRGKQADTARAKVTINAWSDILAYGPERLVAAAKFGSMPPDSAPSLPASHLADVENILASWTKDGK